MTEDCVFLYSYPLGSSRNLPAYPTCDRELGPMLGPDEIVNFGANQRAKTADAASDPRLKWCDKWVLDETIEKGDLVHVGLYRCGDFLYGILRMARGRSNANPKQLIKMQMRRF